MSRKEDTFKEALPDDEFQRLQDAWKEANDPKSQMFAGDEAERTEFKNFIRYKMNKLMEEYDPPAENGDETISKVGQGVMNALDYGTGMLRTAGMASAAALGGRGDLVKGQDFVDAIHPFDGRPAPSTEEWMDRGGIPKGESTSELYPERFTETGTEGPYPWSKFKKGGLFDITPRGVAALVGDMGLSPGGVKTGKKGWQALRGNPALKAEQALTAPARKAQLKALVEAGRKRRLEPMMPRLLNNQDKKFGLEFVPGKALRAAGKGAYYAANPEQAVKDVGREMYRFTLSPVDYVTKRVNGDRASDILLENNVWGTAENVQRGADDVRRGLGQEVSSTVKDWARIAPNERVPRVDMRKPVTEKLYELGTKPSTHRQAEQVQKKLADEFGIYPKNKRYFTLEELQELKQAYQERARLAGGYNVAPANNVRPTSSVDRGIGANVLGDAYAMQANQFREAIEELLDHLETGAGGQVYSKNRQIQTLLHGEKPLLDMAKPVNRGWTPKDWLPTTMMGTGVGLGMNKLGGAAVNATRAGLLSDNAEEARRRTPWEILDEELRNQGY